MENNFGAWFRQPDLQPLDLNMLSSSLNPNFKGYRTLNITQGEILSTGSPANPNFKGYRTLDPPHRFRQNYNFILNSTLKKEIPISSFANPEEAVSPNRKRFIVFDQSGGQTTAIFSSGIRTALCPNISNVGDKNEIMTETMRDTRQCASHVVTNEGDGYENGDMGTEMHEDTDEINALLYSSDEDEDSEDDEEASTGHSPCVITEIGEEEVASSFRPAKRLKSADGGYDNVSSDNFRKKFDNEYDAESCCGDGENDKRLRKEKIRETVSILQKILPVGKDKDVVMILNEAIGYLKSLKRKALDLGIEIL